MVFGGGGSAFSRERRVPVSSTVQMVTLTCWRCASASAAAAMVLVGARVRYFLVGRAAADAIRARQKRAAVSLIVNMGRDSSTGWEGFPRPCFVGVRGSHPSQRARGRRTLYPTCAKFLSIPVQTPI